MVLKPFMCIFSLLLILKTVFEAGTYCISTMEEMGGKKHVTNFPQIIKFCERRC